MGGGKTGKCEGAATMANIENTLNTTPDITYEPSNGSISLNLGELWDYRELLYFLTLRDISVRYKQAALGVAWAVLQPLFTMVVFSVIFGQFAKLPSDGIPYPIFSFAALLPW